jgi:Protein of unknown function (DUF3093)
MPRSANTSRYTERLYLAWWAWPLPLAAAGLIAAEIHLGYPGVRSWLPYVLLIPVAVLLLLLAGRTRIGIDQDTLQVGQAQLPLQYAGAVEVIARQDKRKALGPELDPAAYMLHRGWVGPLVRVQVTDDQDPTPYWIFSTRRPERVAELIRSATRAETS